jgi:hypothetical protein
MKKLLLLLFGAFLLSASVSAKVLVPLTVSIEEDQQSLGPGYPKTPITAPKVYIEDYTLSFEVGHPEYVLNIKDENDNVVYTTTVYSSQTQVVLPSTLSGDYQIELVMGYWHFTGWINL